MGSEAVTDFRIARRNRVAMVVLVHLRPGDFVHLVVAPAFRRDYAPDPGCIWRIAYDGQHRA